MAESPSQPPIPASILETDTRQYWCYRCIKRVSTETLANESDVICLECKNGFVELITAAATPPSNTPSLTSDQADDSTFGSQFLQMLRIIAQAAREEDTPPPLPQDPYSEDDFLRIELNGWDNDEDEEDDKDSNKNENEENRDEGEHDDGEDISDNETEEENREDEEEDMRRRRRDFLRLRIREFATRARSGRNRILDWAEILMGLEDNSIEFLLEVPETDRYIGNPEDYVDAAGYEALLQNLAESDDGRRGAPPASKSSVSALPTAVITLEEQTRVCAICKDMVNVGETETKLPCDHGYHGDCIVPWLGSRNSCPVCRFELPTDDTEYEEERKKKPATAAAVSGASGSGGEGDSLGSN
ncbi:E3 ubiquitin-protein ligase CIP8 [Ricinus communis]|uniref:RING-type E3 ubiquitin transferase n=1 Tax=Ricinus communis TaxID=3988 RepID=B9R8B0_RICCO|nr:E3 ubiquitin-protein ligase CIP8 [Ricinus communis]EEF52740.1 zinc finger protein, putative [Ricinus communis]|eukprot:XP_002510553.1 E3 ubiquitin-protein ligase CIP8 [Ricinus communis]